MGQMISRWQFPLPPETTNLALWWNPKVAVMPNLSSSVTLKIVIKTASGAISGNNKKLPSCQHSVRLSTNLSNLSLLSTCLRLFQTMRPSPDWISVILGTLTVELHNIPLTHFGMLQTAFSDGFCSQKSCRPRFQMAFVRREVLCLNSSLKFVLTATILTASSYYLTQWLTCSLAHMYVTRSQYVKTSAFTSLVMIWLSLPHSHQLWEILGHRELWHGLVKPN